MKVQLVNGVLTIKTGITVEQAAKAYGKRMVAKDDKGNDVYAVSEGTTPSLTAFGITTNQVVDNELAYVVVTAKGAKQEDILKEHGDAILAAKKYIPTIAANIEAHAAELNSVFDAE